jgi:Ca2+-binding RTX toxin-like protein
MAVIATQNISRAGGAATYAAVSAGGDKFTPGDHTFVHFKNASAGSVTVTLVTPLTQDGLAVDDVVVAVGAGADSFIGPLPGHLFRGSDGYGSITYSAAASVTLAVLAA